MNAKELRIGNYLNFPFIGRYVSIVGICLTDKKELRIQSSERDNYYHEPIDVYDPIPLTEEWLVKLGFSKFENKMQIDGIEMKLLIDEDKTYFSSCGKIGRGLVVLCICRGNYFANNLLYVHQVQNLYYALTGEELIIN